MADIIDLTGRPCGRLVVLRRIDKRLPHRSARELWLCQCTCGSTPIVQREALLDGSVTACGICSHPETIARERTRWVATASTTIVCRVCKEAQPLTAFALSGPGTYGRMSCCKRCEALRHAVYRARKKAERDQEAHG